jgi:hypothetical protein
MGPWSLYQKQQQTLLSFIRPLLFCSESHLPEKSLLIEITLKKNKHTMLAGHFQPAPIASSKFSPDDSTAA